MSGMRLLDRHMSLFSGSLRTLMQRESDRRRWADSSYAWLFQPYMGEEMVALACQVSPGQSPVVSVAAVIFSPGRVHTSQAWVATLADERSNSATLRRHQQLYATDKVLMPNAEHLGALAEFIGNRPLIGWQLERSLEHLNHLFKVGIGFGLPNAQVDVGKLHYRQLRRLHPQSEMRSQIAEALACWQMPVFQWIGVLGDATASALLYLRLQREAARHV